MIRTWRPSTSTSAGGLPARVARGLAGVAAAEDQQVDERVGAGGAAVRAGRQPHRADQVGRARSSRGGRPGWRRRACSGELSTATSPPGRVSAQGLDDEVVVQAVAAGVVPRVVQAHVGERHVPDRQVEVAVRQPRVRERLGADVGVGVQRSRDRARCVGSSSTPISSRAGGREAEEDPGAAAGLEHPAAGEPELR